MKLGKESRSNFTNKQSENESVKKRIVKILDEAGRALLVKSAKCDPSVLSAFYEVANSKLELCREFGCSAYDAEADFHTLVINRLTGAKEGETNG